MAFCRLIQGAAPNVLCLTTLRSTNHCSAPASVSHVISMPSNVLTSCHRPVLTNSTRQYSSAAASFPLNGRVISPVHSIVDRSASSDVAVLDRHQGAVTYQRIYRESECLANALATGTREACSPTATTAGSGTGYPPCVAVLCSNGSRYIAAQWACWSLGKVFVPLCSQHPPKMMEYFLTDSSAGALVYDTANANVAIQLSEKLDIPCLNVDNVLADANASRRASDGRRSTWTQSVSDWSGHPATLFYTSGTTGPPKGVPITHGNLCASIRSIASAWEMSAGDSVLHCLPLHHVHGVVNALAVPLAMGAHVNMLPKFDAEAVWTELLGTSLPSVADSKSQSASNARRRPTMFMAVPTMYAKLSQFAEDCRLSAEQQAAVIDQCEQLRVMVSGSAPLPDPVLQAWEGLTGHRLLERYGMTEIGMGLTNPLHGHRTPGAVGDPFPGVEARIVGGDGQVFVEGSSSSTTTQPGYAGEQGELQIKGPSVFHGYWQKPEATENSFTDDGWFLTGDTAVYEKGVYRIVGRTSVDIIKYGGYKISALDIERCLLAHPDIADCAIVGLPDTTYGQIVTAIIVSKTPPAGQEASSVPSLEGIADFVRRSLPPYTAPRQLRVTKELPRNAMGKVNKKELIKLVESDQLA